jgi:hypothetical protein
MPALVVLTGLLPKQPRESEFPPEQVEDGPEPIERVGSLSRSRWDSGRKPITALTRSG